MIRLANKYILAKMKLVTHCNKNQFHQYLTVLTGEGFSLKLKLKYIQDV